MFVVIVGKQSFVSKKGVQCNILHVLQQQENVTGSAASTMFVSDEVFNKASINQKYNIVYGAYANGKAYVLDLTPVSSGSGSHE